MPTPPKRPRRLLEALAHKVRHLRLERSLTLLEAAKLAGFSRRFLVEIEASRANPSIGKLSQLAIAFDIPLKDLCDLPACNIPAKRIAVIGMRGAGKTTVGEMVASRLNVPFFELGKLVEEQTGLTVDEVFELHGSDGYRRFESEALNQWLNENNEGVLAVPGGVVSSSSTYDHVLGSCHSIWLHALPEDYIRRVREQDGTKAGVAEASTLERMKDVVDQRETEYSRAEHHIQTSGHTPQQSCEQIFEKLGLRVLN